jgi:hypothetical protein
MDTVASLTPTRYLSEEEEFEKLYLKLDQSTREKIGQIPEPKGFQYDSPYKR